MPTQTPSQATKRRTIGGVTIPTGQEIYDGLMIRIEPELMTRNLTTLDAPYKNETEAQKKVRYKRYSKAFAEYKKAYVAWSKAVSSAAKEYKRILTKAAERSLKKREESELLDLEKAISA